jgi:hypothetical protein
MLRIRVVSILPEMLGVGGVSRQAIRDDPSSPIFSVLYLIDQALNGIAGEEETYGWILSATGRGGGGGNNKNGHEIGFSTAPEDVRL